MYACARICICMHANVMMLYDWTFPFGGLGAGGGLWCNNCFYCHGKFEKLQETLGNHPALISCQNDLVVPSNAQKIELQRLR